MRHRIENFARGEHAGTRADGSGRLVLKTDAAVGEWVSPVLEAETFDEVVPSWNALTPGESQVRIEARVRVDGAWTTWYNVGVWGTRVQRRSTAGQRDDVGRVDVDLIRLAEGKVGDAVQARLGLTADEKRGGPSVYRLAVHTHLAGTRQPLDGERHAAWGRVLNVPQRSQMVEPSEVRGHICSPTAVAMMLEYHGVAAATEEACAGTHDYGAGIWGNWPFNTAYVFAASNGRLAAEVERWDALRPLEEEIARGRPVVLSHAWREGELDGAPIPRSAGHLIVVVGFDASGNVVVNDPAADPGRGQAVRRTYARGDIYRTWLERSKGVVYTVRPHSETSG